MLILGVNAYHADAAACLLRNGAIVAAAEEERFCRQKHWAGFPSRSIAYCLAEAGVGISDVHHIALNTDPRANFGRKFLYLLKARPTWSLIKEKLAARSHRLDVLERLGQLMPNQRFRGRVHLVEHHLAHLNSCFHASTFADAVSVSIDGFGDFSSCAWGAGESGHVDARARVLFPHSLGVFYEAMTQYLGFQRYGDEYKLMGLAACGSPTPELGMDEILREEPNGLFSLNLTFFRHHRHPIGYQWQGSQPTVSRLFSTELERLLGPKRKPSEGISAHHKNIAATTQDVYERALFRLLNAAARQYTSENLCLAGGCAQNSVANGKIREHTPFTNVFVQPAAGDAGGALGAAWHIWHSETRPSANSTMPHSFWGPRYTRDEIEAQLSIHSDQLSQAACNIAELEDSAELCARVAAALDFGKIVGWFQGRMEWGPRALGNRSILADPRRADIRGHLNQRIKHREDFRPFAPSVLREAVAEWFEADWDIPFMTEVHAIRPDKRSLIPAVVHQDGSGRVHTVDRHANPLFHDLITAFAERTRIPILLNTSFNAHEPIVCSPGDALGCFLRTGMDMLVMGPFIVESNRTATLQ